MPGLGKRSAEIILAEIGQDMSRFPTAGHISSWAGVCPGNNESAGKRRKGAFYMKNTYKKIVAIVATMALTLSCSVTGLAAEVPVSTDKASTVAVASQGDIASPNNSYSSGGVYVNSSEWVTIATAPNGFGCRVKVHSSCPYLGSYLSICMRGRNGNIVWSETRSVGAQGTREYDCGRDVYKIEAKYTYSAGTVTCYPSN